MIRYYYRRRRLDILCFIRKQRIKVNLYPACPVAPADGSGLNSIKVDYAKRKSRYRGPACPMKSVDHFIGVKFRRTAQRI